MGPIKTVSGNTTHGINGHVITIGGLATVTIQGQAAFAGACDGAKARFEAANRAGGVNGYTFNYIGCTDDAASAVTAQQVLQQDIQQKHVFAMIPMSTQGAISPTLLNSSHTYYSGFGQGYCPSWNSEQFGFEATMMEGCVLGNGSQFLSSYTVEALEKVSGLQASQIKFAYVGQNETTNEPIKTAFVSIAKSLGNQVVYAENSLPGATSPPLTDYSPIAGAIVKSGANVILPAVAGPPLFSLIGALKAAGWSGTLGGEALGSSPVLSNPTTAKVVDGMYNESAWNGDSVAYPSPQWTQIANNFSAIGVNPNETEDFGAMWSYTAADIFINALKALKGPLTEENLVNMMNRGFVSPGYGNAICPTYWPEGHVVQSNCVAMSKISNGKLLPALDLGQYGSNYLIPS